MVEAVIHSLFSQLLGSKYDKSRETFVIFERPGVKYRPNCDTCIIFSTCEVKLLQTP